MTVNYLHIFSSIVTSCILAQRQETLFIGLPSLLLNC